MAKMEKAYIGNIAKHMTYNGRMSQSNFTRIAISGHRILYMITDFAFSF